MEKTLWYLERVAVVDDSGTYLGVVPMRGFVHTFKYAKDPFFIAYSLLFREGYAI